MNEIFIQIAGWLPAIIIPTATGIQLFSVIKKPTTEGVNWLTWFLFGIANIGLYIYTEKYTDFQAIFGLLGTASMDFAIVALVFLKRQKQVSRLGQDD